MEEEAENILGVASEWQKENTWLSSSLGGRFNKIVILATL